MYVTVGPKCSKKLHIQLQCCHSKGAAKAVGVGVHPRGKLASQHALTLSELKEGATSMRATPLDERGLSRGWLKTLRLRACSLVPLYAL